MRRFIFLGLLFLCAILSVRADTEVLVFTLPLRFDSESLSANGRVPSSPDASISSWKESVHIRSTELGPDKQTTPSSEGHRNQEQSRDVWLELDLNRLLEGRTKGVKGMLKVSWLARSSTTLSITGPVPKPSDASKAYLKISAIYLTSQQIPDLIVTLEPLYLGVLPSSSLPLVGMLMMILFGLRRIGAYRWLVRKIRSIVEDSGDKSK